MLPRGNRAVRGDEDEMVRGQCIPVAVEFIADQSIEMDGGQAPRAITDSVPFRRKAGDEFRGHRT